MIISPLPYKNDTSYISQVSSIENDLYVFNIIGKDKPREINRKIILYMGIIKKDNFELAIEKAVELGVYEINPVLMDFSKSNFNSSYNKYKNDKNNEELNVLNNKDVERLNRISYTASTQSNRPYIPIIKNDISTDEMIKKIDKNCSNIVFYENKNGIKDTIDYLSELNKTNNEINIIIGPEGGFSERELDLFKSNNYTFLSLGDRVLRAETAAISALSLISIYA